MSLRRNFLHNRYAHRAAAWIWLIADISGIVGWPRLKRRAVARGEHIHALNCVRHPLCFLLVSVCVVEDVLICAALLGSIYLILRGSY